MPLTKLRQDSYGRRRQGWRTIIPEQQENPTTAIRDNVNYRRHKGACPFYREYWPPDAEPDASGDEVLYRIICLMDTPPVNQEEQHLCMHSPNGCWRLRQTASRRNGRNGHESE